MKQNRDAGTSSAAAFLMILAVILVCAGVFAAAVLPAEETREAERQADAAGKQNLKNSFREGRTFPSPMEKNWHTAVRCFGKQ